MFDRASAYHGIFAKLRMLDIFEEPPADLYGPSLADLYHHSTADFVCDVPVFERFLPPGGRVLDLACGSGRIGIAMARRGAMVDGIELSPTMLALAREAAERETLGVKARLRFIEGDMTRFALEERYDLVILGVTSISLLLRAEERQGLFRSVRAHLKSGAHFIFDILDLSGDRWKELDHFHDVWAKEVDEGLDFAIIGQEFFPERRQFVFNVYREFMRWDGTTRRTLGASVKAWLDRDELVAEMRDAGLGLAQEFDEPGGQFTTHYFVARVQEEEPRHA